MINVNKEFSERQTDDILVGVKNGLSMTYFARKYEVNKSKIKRLCDKYKVNSAYFEPSNFKISRDMEIIRRQQRVFNFTNKIDSFILHSKIVRTPDGYKLKVWYLFNLPVFQTVISYYPVRR